ncbi:response regulator transcription factor [Anaerolineales bacterium HSG6]|nr:response regulator transcription factor [Anaerolineales bacterium HSG6]MDM8529815.1 response regulator transcription factor [Anaerolineales bacterium HSG25]
MKLLDTNKILVVDDEENVRFFLAEELEAEGYKVFAVASGAEALEFLAHSSVDLAIVDFQMPGLTGIQLMEAMQSLTDVPELIMLTAHATLDTSIEAMRLGSCDFLLKPYVLDDLLRGIHSAMSRRQQKTQQRLAVELLTTSVYRNPASLPSNRPDLTVLAVGDLTINLDEMSLMKAGTPITLTPTEFKLLATMVKRPNHPFTFQELAKTVHGQYLTPHQARDMLKSHLGRLRRKMGASYIVNLRGVGYKFVDAHDQT